MAAKKKKSKSSDDSFIQSAWVRAHHDYLEAKPSELLARAEAEGVEVSMSTINNVRSIDKKKQGLTSPRGSGRKAAASGSAEMDFIQAVGALGVSRAQTLLDALKKL